jgi:hypothetical protein
LTCASLKKTGTDLRDEAAVREAIFSELRRLKYGPHEVSAIVLAARGFTTNPNEARAAQPPWIQQRETEETPPAS